MIYLLLFLLLLFVETAQPCGIKKQLQCRMSFCKYNSFFFYECSLEFCFEKIGYKLGCIESSQTVVITINITGEDVIKHILSRPIFLPHENDTYIQVCMHSYLSIHVLYVYPKWQNKIFINNRILKYNIPSYQDHLWRTSYIIILWRKNLNGHKSFVEKRCFTMIKEFPQSFLRDTCCAR